MYLKIHRTTVRPVVYQNLNIDTHIHFKTLNWNVTCWYNEQVRKLEGAIMFISKKIGLKFPTKKLGSIMSNFAKDVL